MNDIAIRAQGISKKYFIGNLRTQEERLGEKLASMVTSPFRKALRILQGDSLGAAQLQREMWALRGVGFEIRRGEVVGIIGRNGAGKSTLLKILSRITEPTKGWAELYGRVGSLLEVGTGFHPELTGRENVYLNGALLGMKGEEIRRKFDRIVSFAEIEEFVDTPVKHYSSGMYVRLAFSVAAHLEPEILLIDEVLAVGDTAFQHRCLGKMNDVAREGRTVIFVSHNMGLIQSLCQRSIFLNEGAILLDGPTEEVIEEYLFRLEGASSQDLSERSDRSGLGQARLVRVEVSGGRGGDKSLRAGGFVRFTVEIDRLLPGMNCNILIYDSFGQPLSNFESKVRGKFDSVSDQNKLRFVCEVDELYLRPGRYRADIALTGDKRLQDFVQGAATFAIAEGQIGGRPTSFHKRFRVSMPHRWIRPASH